jgi:hypothetical protein
LHISLNEDKGVTAMKRKPVGNDMDRGTPGTTWKASRIRRSVAAVALAGALVLGFFGAAHNGQPHATQTAGSTWSKMVSTPEMMGSTWS